MIGLIVPIMAGIAVLLRSSSTGSAPAHLLSTKTRPDGTVDVFDHGQFILNFWVYRGERYNLEFSGDASEEQLDVVMRTYNIKTQYPDDREAPAPPAAAVQR